MKYFCYDTALNEEYTLIQLMQRFPEYTNIFEGTDDAGIWDAAPWMFKLNNNPYELKGLPLIKLNHCVVFETKDPLKLVLDYLQSKIYIKENGQSMYLRIWDARVLLQCLQEWPKVDLQDFFNVFDAVYTESEEDDYLYKWCYDGAKVTFSLVLKQDGLPVIKSEEELDREYEAMQQSGNGVFTQPSEINNVQEQRIEEVEQEKPKRRRFLTD